MNQKIKSFFSMIIFIVGMSGCSQSTPPINQVLTPAPATVTSAVTSYSLETPTIQVSSTATSFPLVTPTTEVILTGTPLPLEEPTFTATISPVERKENLKYFLQNNGNCNFPCFWGIQPESTTRSELYNLFQQLEEKGSETNNGNHLYVSSTFRFEEKGGLYVDLQADVQENIVRNIVVSMDGPWDSDVSSQEWSIYSLDEVLRTYGHPSSVELYLDFPYGMLIFGIRLRYEEIDTSIYYDGGYKSNAQNHTATDAIVCPKENIADIKLHMGKHPFNYEPSGVSLSDATKLDVQTFHRLFVKNPSACLTVNLAAMGWN